MKRCLVIVLTALIIMSLLSVAFADTAVPYASRVFQTTVVPIGISGGKVEASAYASSVYTASKLGVQSFKIQVKNGSSWSTVKSVSGAYAYNTSSYSKTLTCSATSGKQYRAVATFYGTVNGVSDSITVTGATKTAP